MGQSTKSTRPGLPHTGRPHGSVNLAISKHDSHGRVPAEPKLSASDEGGGDATVEVAAEVRRSRFWVRFSLGFGFCNWVVFVLGIGVVGPRISSFNLLCCNFKEIRLRDKVCYLRSTPLQLQGNKISYLQSAPLQLQGDKTYNFNLLHCNFREIREIRFSGFNLLHCNFRKIRFVIITSICLSATSGVWDLWIHRSCYIVLWGT
ncbi:UDP-N-acetylmuramoylalanine--D-glutamate ligase [Gossypium arboreum]|uniref:UDP-N-acetylmuramoylalanine--D-glutamate ligase n=1 Tax=Gossypium arboreum TaxID=29729 RepID=A0A0B0PAV9_GOSAR|nr:UDP-N-acetylmuramoylalanine--D-glutamate ligase [Gossypium arboreum]